MQYLSFMEQTRELSSISNVLVQICKLHRTRSNQLMAEAGIHSGQDLLLYFLSKEDGQTVSSLVEKLCNQHATLFNMVARMEANGMVKKGKDAEDRRISRVYITEAGRRAYARVQSIWEEVEERCLMDLGPEQRETLLTLLQKVQKNLG